MRSLSLLLLAVVGCGPSDPHAPSPDRVSRVVQSAEGATAQVVAGNTAFAWDLHRELVMGQGGGNLLFSPLSASAALGMTSAGALGQTATEMSQVLEVRGDADAWHGAFGTLLDDLSGDKARGYRIEVANRLFGQEGMPWSAAFEATCLEDWRAPVEDVDFVGDAEGSRQRINDWVATQTQDRIPALLPPGSVGSDTRLVLTNAVYFLASWWTRFDEARTGPYVFQRSDGSTVEAQMMWVDLEGDDHRVRVDHGEEATVIRLPYEDDEVAAYVLYPHEADGLAALESSLTGERFEALIEDVVEGAERTHPQKEQLGLPTFELRWSGSLRPALHALGMVDLFDSGAADLGGMADAGAADDLYVDDVLHEAWMRVDEEGTEAAAATAVVTRTVSATVPLVVDRPFLFVVRDDLTGSVLFIARIEDPAAP